MKKKTVHIGLIITLAVLIGCKGEQKETEQVVEEVIEVTKEVKKSEAKKLTVSLENKSDSETTGNVVFKEEGGKVTMTGVFKGLSEGTHAIHLHEKADCSSVDGKSTGGHWNPTNQPHGEWGDEAGYHKGDIGNFIADANGDGKIKFSTNEWCIGCDDDTKNIVGKAIIVHQGMDDLASQPSGAAGMRISCGEIN